MEYKCNSCREVSALSPKARFCPICGSTSLVLVVKEQTEPTQKETVGVYNSATIGNSEYGFVDEKEEEDQPRRKR